MSEEVDPSALDSSLESPALSGTVRLAQSALRSPPPPAQAEAESLRQVETLMQDAALSPRVLRELDSRSNSHPWLERLRFWKR